MKPFWTQIEEAGLAQGDLLPECHVPVFEPSFGTDDEPIEVPVSTVDLIIVTQSCDLANEKVKLVACCPVCDLKSFEQINPEFQKKGKWESVRKGRLESLHLLASPEDPEDNLRALVVDFGQIISLPFSYMTERAVAIGPRWRLDSPFLEHFSQAFARFFMRVGLPSSIAPYK